MDAILEKLPYYQKSMLEVRELVLANLLMVGEIPAPTFGEATRIEFLCNRFSECGLHNCCTDEAGNGTGVLPGTEGQRTILLVAHSDTVFPDTVDHTMSVQNDRVVGPGVGDNSLGVATLASVPTLLQHLGIQLKSNLLFMGAARSLGLGDLEGIKFFLSNTDLSIDTAVCVEGMQLGRLSYTSIGMIRGEITCTVPEEFDWTRMGASGAIVTLNEIITKINAIPLPKRPVTTIVLGSVSGGTSYNTVANHAKLRFEVRSESQEMVDAIRSHMEDIAAEMNFRSGANVEFRIVAQRNPGGIAFTHPLIHNTRKIMDALNVQPQITPSTSELSALIASGVPALTLGITSGERHNQQEETVMIEPIFKGLTGLIGLLLAIDGGHCDLD